MAAEYLGSARPNHDSKTLYLTLKRAVDVVVVVLAAPAVILILLIASAAVALSMGGPILFVQDRVGRNGRIFRMYKLRTMVPSHTTNSTATLKHDPRVTPLGRWLRRAHIDELPQLWNILRGEMTLIGPRPEQPHLVEVYRRSIHGYDLRHTVTPGLSGYSQVCFGYATDLAETRQKFEYDLYYVENIGPILDAMILIRTFQVYSRPAYVR